VCRQCMGEGEKILKGEQSYPTDGVKSVKEKSKNNGSGEGKLPGKKTTGVSCP